MARSQSSGALKYVGAAAAAIVGGIAIGYLYGGARVPHPSVQAVQPPVSATLAPPPSVTPSSIHPRKTNGNYTAPGAPQIVIQEESQPILRRTAPAPADPEATQEAAPTPHTGLSQPADTTSAPPPGSAHDPAPPTGTTDTNGGTSHSDTPLPANPPPAPADPDFEQVNSGGKPPAGSGSSDPESGQQGGSTSGDSGKVQFRVQTGAYTDESNARSVADQLRSQGYATSTHSERQGDHLVYKVQVGAYRSKNGASKAADDLQKKGFPAFVSPIAP